MDAKYQIFWYLAAIPIAATIITADEGSITATLGSPLMTLEKIKSSLAAMIKLPLMRDH
jgi:hypothetical protein